jgi:hypothetical protein
MKDDYAKIRLSTKEKIKLRAKAQEKGMSISAYIRWRCLYEPKSKG